MEIFNNMTLIEIILDAAIVIVLLLTARQFYVNILGKSPGKMAKKGSPETELQKTKYLSWIDRFRDDYEKQIRYVQEFQVNLLKFGIFLLVILICQKTIDVDLNSANVLKTVFFILGFILYISMLWHAIKILPSLLKMAKEINDFQDRNKIGDEGLEMYDKKFFGVTMKDVVGLRKENRNDTYNE
ncbi:MAG: hypothetical protein JW956_09385 [Calditrichaceae bacterium]|nr:hypothetical protein [Calditrichaceae bacterium]